MWVWSAVGINRKAKRSHCFPAFLALFWMKSFFLTNVWSYFSAPQTLSWENCIVFIQTQRKPETRRFELWQLLLRLLIKQHSDLLKKKRTVYVLDSVSLHVPQFLWGLIHTVLTAHACGDRCHRWLWRRDGRPSCSLFAHFSGKDSCERARARGSRLVQTEDSSGSCRSGRPFIWGDRYRQLSVLPIR